MNDVRDEALGALLDREATRIESGPVDRLPEVLRRGSRIRTIRFTAIAAAVAVFAGAVSWAGLQNEGRGPIPANIDDWETFASLEVNGWTIQVPPPWRVQELPACSHAPERIGVVVANVDFEFLNPRGEWPECEDRFLLNGFPEDGVAFAFKPVGTRSGFFRQPFDTVLPLEPEHFHRPNGVVGSPAVSFIGIWAGRSNPANVRRWEGPDASLLDLAALDRMISSLQVRGALSWVEAEVAPKHELHDLLIAIDHPSGWELRTYPRWSVIDAPNPIAALMSPGLQRGLCRLEPLAPWIGVGRFRDASVFVLISDATDSWQRPDLPARPDLFRFQDAIEDVKGRCGPDVRAVRFGFKAAGRQIHVDVMASGSVYREQPEILLHIVNSIRIEGA
jgi:hypothetical protein